MNIINPFVEYYNEPNPLKKIERVARVCWNTETRITDTSARPFCEKLIKMGHMSPFEHARVKVPWGIYINLKKGGANASTPYGHIYRSSIFCDDEKGDFFQINARDFLALGGTLDELETLNDANDYTTVLFTVDIGISRELIRHRQMSFMERSTRYVNYKHGVEFIRPLPFDWAMKSTLIKDPYHIWLGAIHQAQTKYCAMIEKGCSPQEARSALPLSTATRLYVTGRYDQWKDVIKLRTASGAHPQMRYAMDLLLSNQNCPEAIK